MVTSLDVRNLVVILIPINDVTQRLNAKRQTSTGKVSCSPSSHFTLKRADHLRTFIKYIVQRVRLTGGEALYEADVV